MVPEFICIAEVSGKKSIVKKRGPETTLEVLGEVCVERGEGKLRQCQGIAMS